MTAVAARVAGPSIPAGRIFGSGTCLDSSRLQSLLAQKLEIDAQSVTGYVVGEHGDSSVALWSTVRVFLCSCVFFLGYTPIYIVFGVYMCVFALYIFKMSIFVTVFHLLGGGGGLSILIFSFSPVVTNNVFLSFLSLAFFLFGGGGGGGLGTSGWCTHASRR